MTPQTLLTSGPIVCTKCTHGHQVEVITDRGVLEGSVEYHCGCGNYAVVGKPTHWPFAVAVKTEKDYSKNYSDIGIENISKKETRMGTPVLKCSREGCEEPLAAGYLCAGHFQEAHGITAIQYKENKRFATEGVKKVAMRLKNQDETDRIKRGQDAKETFDQAMQEEKEKKEAKTWPGEDIPTAESKAVPDIEKEEKAETSILITLPNSLVERIEKAALEEFRPFHMQVYYYLHHGMKAVGQ